MQHNNVVVFDFDLTLTRWETASRFFKQLLRRQPWRWAVVGLALPVLLPLFLVPATRRLPVRFAVWVATFGRSRAGMEALAQAHADALFAEGDTLFLPEALHFLRQHLADGDRVVIATGCWEPLARALLQRGGLRQVPLVASTLRPFLGGWVSEDYCLGENKVPMLAARGFPPPWAWAYTDHHMDVPILRHSQQWRLISPAPKCQKRIEQALGRPASVLAWRTTAV